MHLAYTPVQCTSDIPEGRKAFLLLRRIDDEAARAHSVVRHWQRKHERIESVEQSTVAWNDRTAVAHLGREGGGESEQARSERV